MREQPRAWLVAAVRMVDGRPAIVGADLFSESSPTTDDPGGTMLVRLMEGYGGSYGDAVEDIRSELEYWRKNPVFQRRAALVDALLVGRSAEVL